MEGKKQTGIGEESIFTTQEPNIDLASYIPSGDLGAEVGIRYELAPVVERISKVLPSDVLWNLFSSSPRETGGKIIFPDCRVDNSVEIALVYSYLDKESGRESDSRFEWYHVASEEAFKALVWVDIGFDGLENLAKSNASVNWTSAVGHFVNDKERERGIMTRGKKMYEECLREFVSFRGSIFHDDDIFNKYGVEFLLEKFRRL